MCNVGGQCRHGAAMVPHHANLIAIFRVNLERVSQIRKLDGRRLCPGNATHQQTRQHRPTTQYQRYSH